MNSLDHARVTYRVAEFAAMTGLARSTISDYIRRGMLASIRIPGVGGRRAVILIPAAALRDFLDAHRVPPRGDQSER